MVFMFDGVRSDIEYGGECYSCHVNFVVSNVILEENRLLSWSFME